MTLGALGSAWHSPRSAATRREWHNAGEETGLAFAFPPANFMTQAKWLLDPAAAEHLGIKPVTLRAMRREGRLTPGRDWIFLTGSRGGPVGYDLAAIETTLAKRTQELVSAETERQAKTRQKRTAAIETFAGDNNLTKTK